MSGLGVNLLKSTLFLDGNDTNTLRSLASNYGLSHGTLPVRYLGVPLIPHKMKASDFQPLLERIQSRFTSWTTRQLSFAGRLQLLQSVINSVINFWGSIFLLPKQCLLRIERLCNAFLWSGNTISGKQAKISWEVVCSPRRSGGLGLRRLAKWNSVLALKLIWMLFSDSGSLWVAWVRAHLLSSTSFWDIRHPQHSGSWMWNKLLKLRTQARPFIHCRVGSGFRCYFWQDDWTGLGPLSLLLGTAAIPITGICYEATVHEAICSGRWRLPTRSRNPIITFLRDSLPDPALILSPLAPDTYHWLYPDEIPSHQRTPSRFSASRTFASIFTPPPEVSWHSQVWFSGRIPKHAFVTWLAVHDRLATRDRIRRFSPSTIPTCLLCNSHNESRDHLFFLCPYSYSLLQLVLHMIPTHRSLSSLLQWLPRSSPNKPLKLIAHLLLQATVYILWRERNSRLHTNTCRPIVQLARDIQTTIKAKLIALTSPTNHDTPSLTETWFGLQTHTHPFRFHQ